MLRLLTYTGIDPLVNDDDDDDFSAMCCKSHVADFDVVYDLFQKSFSFCP